MKSKKVKRSFLKNLFVSAKAEEKEALGNGTETPEPVEAPKEEKPTEPEAPKTEPTSNELGLVERVRKEEKAKLYPQIEKLKADKADLLGIVSDRDKEIADLKAENAKLKSANTKLKEDAAKGVKTNTSIQEMTLKLSQLEADYEKLEAEKNDEIQQIKVDAHREKLLASTTEIIPELVKGKTQEELDAAFELSKQRFEEIKNAAISNVQMPYTNPASASMTNTFQGKSMTDIASMSPSEWAEARKELGLK